jgi:quercetin dioxygenase-like cupin family protein
MGFAVGVAAFYYGRYPLDGLWGEGMGKGNRTEAVDQFALGDQIPGFEGYALRKRYIVTKKPGVVRIHSHFGRPAFSYIVEGPVKQYRSDTADPILMPVGDLSADYNMAHWWTNEGEGVARWYIVDMINLGGSTGE